MRWTKKKQMNWNISMKMITHKKIKMNIGDRIKSKLKDLKLKEEELKQELTTLHFLRNIGKEIDTGKFKEINKELRTLREKIKEFKKLVKNN